MAKRKQGNKRKSIKPMPVEVVDPLFTEVHLNEGREDFPYKRGTMQDLGTDFGDEFGVVAAKAPSSEVGGLVSFVVLVGLAVYCMLSALEPLNV